MSTRLLVASGRLLVVRTGQSATDCPVLTRDTWVIRTDMRLLVADMRASAGIEVMVGVVVGVRVGVGVGVWVAVGVEPVRSTV